MLQSRKSVHTASTAIGYNINDHYIKTTVNSFEVQAAHMLLAVATLEFLWTCKLLIFTSHLISLTQLNNFSALLAMPMHRQTFPDASYVSQVRLSLK
jgi:hypothetical protein